MLKKIQKWIDLGATFIASLLIAAMFFVLVINVILRAIPAVGGFKWYMEFSQYANVWALLIGAAGIGNLVAGIHSDSADGADECFGIGYLFFKLS